MAYEQEIVNLFVEKIQYYKKEAERKGAATGIISDGRVVVGGQSYYFDSISDRYLDNGSIVTVAISDNGNAVILG
jgi:hypothetical protein